MEEHMDTEAMTLVVIAIAIALAIFLICRELVCWYNKTNRKIALLERQNALLEEILGHLESIERKNG